MIFKRRDSPSLLARGRDLLRPRKGWRRGFEYIGRRVQRLPDTPHRIALGFACGVFASFTPLFSLHIAVGLLTALALRANLLAAALGTVVGNPLTFPVIAAAAIAIGGRVAGGGGGAAEGFELGAVFHDLSGFRDHVFLPYLVGGTPLGLGFGVLSYGLVRPVVAAYQRRRRKRLGEIARRRMAKHLAGRRVKTGAARVDAAE
jgi:uncharacterized protein (DUF2062 family)